MLEIVATIGAFAVLFALWAAATYWDECQNRGVDIWGQPLEQWEE